MVAEKVNVAVDAPLSQRKQGAQGHPTDLGSVGAVFKLVLSKTA